VHASPGSYNNEAGVSDGIAAALVPRSELFVTTKLRNNNHRPGA